MSAKDYAQYLPRDFDNFDCLKIAPGVYLILLFVLRAYIIWIMSVTNMRDHVGIIQWLYPQQALFYLNLLSGSVGLFVVLLLSLRRPNAAPWVRRCWPKCHYFLIAALVFDFLVVLFGYLFWHFQSLSWLILQLMLVLLASLYLLRSKRLAINLKEFPETLPEK